MINKNVHCESCGDEEPTLQKDCGYTACCNELTCGGNITYKYTDGKKTVIGCCSAMVEKEFAKSESYWRIECQRF